MGTAADMSDYERTAWQALLGEVDKQAHQSHRFADWAQGVKARADAAAAQARAAVARVPVAGPALEAADAAITTATEGLHTALVERGLNSVAPAGVFALFADDGVPVRSYGEVRRLDLQHCDRSVPRRKDRYLALAAAEGVASSLAVTGAEVSATVSGGTSLTVAVAAIAADVTTVMVGMGRIVAVAAAHYGYDVREPEEQLFAAGVLAYSSATTTSEQAAALAALSRLTRRLMRRDTWRQPQHDQTLTVVQRMSTSLGFNLVKRKLAQTVPLVGAVINGGLNARIAHLTFQRSQHAYRLRFLTEKYGLDPARWAPQVVHGAIVGVPLVDEVLNAELSGNGDQGT